MPHWHPVSITRGNEEASSLKSARKRNALFPCLFKQEALLWGADRELPHEGEQAFRLLDLRKVTSLWDEFEASVRERLGIGTAILRVDHAIALSPHNQDWDAHMPEPPPQLWITHAQTLIIDVECPQVGLAGLDLFRGHGRRINAEGRRIMEAEGGKLIRRQRGHIGHGMPLNSNAAGIDKNETAKPPRGIVQSHGRGDPAAHRGANDQHIPQVEPFEQVKIGEGEIINTVEPFRTWLARKARVGRHQDVRPGQTSGEASHGLRAATTMQDENGTTAVLSLVKAYGQAISERLSASSGRRRRESAHSMQPFCWVQLPHLSVR